MGSKTVLLFYKTLVTLGGAEVLLGQHYIYLKRAGYAPKVICFEQTRLERIEVDSADIIELGGCCTLVQIWRLWQLLRRLKVVHAFCHSGHVEFGLAARLAGRAYSVFLHQPTTMSYNETDKYAWHFFDRYKRFARRDRMFDEIVSAYEGLSWPQRLHINLRAFLSHWGLRGARHLFVLSEYAVREKREIFGLHAHHLSGAIPQARLEALREKSAIRPVNGTATLVSVSRLDENKRIGLLIDAVAILRANGTDVRLLLGGKGPAENDLKARARHHGLNSEVTFLGYVPENDITNLYAAMDLFVTIDWADFRITTYEVLSENRRVVVSDDTDLDERLLQSGYLFVAPADAERLAEVIVRALHAPLSWDRARLKAYLRDYTWSTYFENIEKVMSGDA